MYNKNNIFVSVGDDNNINVWDVSSLNIGKKKFKESKEKGVKTAHFPQYIKYHLSRLPWHQTVVRANSNKDSGLL